MIVLMFAWRGDIPIDDLRGGILGIPIVMLDGTPRDIVDAHVEIDHRSGIGTALDHLTSTGRTRIAMIDSTKLRGCRCRPGLQRRDGDRHPERLRPGRRPPARPDRRDRHRRIGRRHVRGLPRLRDHAWWELVRAAGVSLEELMAAGLGPVNLETTVRFHREL
jgi:hypothetical protein